MRCRNILCVVVRRKSVGALQGGHQSVGNLGAGLPHAQTEPDGARGCETRPRAPGNHPKPGIPAATVRTQRADTRPWLQWNHMTRHLTTYVQFCLGTNTYSSSHAVCTSVYIQSVRPRPPEHKQSEARMREHGHDPCFADECKTCLNFQMSFFFKFKPPGGVFDESMTLREISSRLQSTCVLHFYIQPPRWC